jgi:hypothetical protein
LHPRRPAVQPRGTLRQQSAKQPGRRQSRHTGCCAFHQHALACGLQQPDELLLVVHRS